MEALVVCENAIRITRHEHAEYRATPTPVLLFIATKPPPEFSAR